MMHAIKHDWQWRVLEWLRATMCLAQLFWLSIKQPLLSSDAMALSRTTSG